MRVCLMDVGVRAVWLVMLMLANSQRDVGRPTFHKQNGCTPRVAMGSVR